MPVKIITDSNCDLPESIVKTYDIEVLPQLVYLDEKEYLDGVTLKSKKVFEDMREGKVYKTAQVPLETFITAFKKYAALGEACLYVGFSSELSGTYQSARMAKEEILEEFPEATLEMIDTKCASLGFGLVVMEAAKAAKAGKTLEEVNNITRFYAEHMEHIFTVDNLEYLCRGGRVSRTSAFVGGLLNIKPLLHVEKGKLIPIEKLRGRHKVIHRMTDMIGERSQGVEHPVIGISHGDDIKRAMELKEKIQSIYGVKEFVINDIGCAVGAHAGPGTLALFFLNKVSPYA